MVARLGEIVEHACCDTDTVDDPGRERIRWLEVQEHPLPGDRREECGSVLVGPAVCRAGWGRRNRWVAQTSRWRNRFPVHCQIELLHPARAHPWAQPCVDIITGKAEHTGDAGQS